MHGISATRRKVILGLLLAGSLVFGSTTLRAATTGGGLAGAPSGAASVYGTDDRKLVNDTTQFPWSAIGLVEVHVGYETYVGTGVMIGRYLALTCGHVVDGSETGNPSSVDFIPGENSGNEPFGRANVVKIIPAPQWAASAADGYDMAIIVLDTPIGDQTGYFQIGVQPDVFFGSAALTTAGYPTDKGTVYQYTVSGHSYGLDGNVIIHDLDSEPGQSGSPIWYGGNDQTARLVGVLEGSYLTMSGEEGIGARIDQQAANWIDEQLAANNDVSQGITGAVTPDSSTSSLNDIGSMCGFGSMQALFGGFLAWSLALVSRRHGR